MAGVRDAATANPSVPLQWPLVGRHDEVDLFAATLGDPRAHGFVIHGPAGVGKTRLADECLAVAARLGRAVARATATDGARTVPLGALAHLLPTGIADERCDLVALFSEVGPVLRGQAEHGPLVLLVDDANLLDATSATLLGQLVDADLVFLVATVRTSEATAPTLSALWQRARVRRIDLTDLSRAGIDTLLHHVLQGPVEASTIADIWTTSQGNVLFVRELVLGALDGGHLVNQRGVWRLIGSLVTTARLAELVEARLGTLGPEATQALDILAVWEPTGLVMLESVVDREVLEALDRGGLLAFRTDGRRQHVTLAHPLYGDILRARMPALTRRRLLLEHANRIEAYGARRREDPIRIATARLDASSSADPRLLVKAARLARHGHDFPQVERLARAAVVEGMTPEAGLLLGEALHELGRFAAAEEVFAAAERSIAGADEELVVLLAEMRARNLMWGLDRDDEALVANRAARDRVREQAGRDELGVNEAMLLTYSGRPAAAIAALASVAPSDQLSPRARALRAQAEVPALVATGRCDTAAERAEVAYAEQLALPDQVAIPDPGVHVLNRIYALNESGRLDEARALATAAYRAVPPSAPSDALIWLANQLGRGALAAGRPETARRWYGEAVARCEEHDVTGPRRLALSGLATAHAWLGDARGATDAVAELDGLPPFAFSRAEQELGRGWAKVAAGDAPGGRQVLLDAAATAREVGNHAAEASLLHDVARLGDPAAVAQRLDELAADGEGALVPTYARHARAVVGGRPAALVEVVDRFEATGASLLAAEAATEAAQAYQRRGERRAASAMSVRAAALAEACEGARTPALRTTASVVPLTARERDIAAFAAQGESSKSIAARLFLSVRTVDNHLQNVYLKLGVTGRRDLAEALAVPDVSSAEPGSSSAEAGSPPSSSSPP